MNILPLLLPDSLNSNMIAPSTTATTGTLAPVATPLGSVSRV
jgi:hypothetical protein